ncbi:hypothetical protein ALC53_03807 [Atta colombica]|uniref:Uncharacterized protein n=1 Tax=Atta colombica TaxID=520822 RepID=A0A195BM79_9HYME|nr:hypothetical protein ALC53_03807 [Atta colombica]
MSWLLRSWAGERVQGEFPGGERDSRHDQKRRSALMSEAGRGRIPGSEGPLGIRDASFVGIVGGVVIESTRRCRRWWTADHGPVKETPRIAFISYGIRTLPAHHHPRCVSHDRNSFIIASVDHNARMRGTL